MYSTAIKLSLFGVLVVLIALSFYVAPTFYPLQTFIDVIRGTADPSVAEIITDYRGIRTLVALLAGATIATSGLILQFVTRNDLASPGMMAMNAGGALVMSVAFSVGLITTNSLLPAYAVVGALATGAVVYIMAYQLQRYHGDTILILIGAMMATVFGGIVQLMMILDETTMIVTLSWLFGSFNNRPADVVISGMVGLVLTLPMLWYISRHMAVVAVSDTMARSVGANIARIKGVAFVGAGFLAGISIAMAGPVAFIGLLVPHLTRMLLKTYDFKTLLLPNMAVGMGIALISDIVSRLILHPTEVSVGIVMAFMGCPFLLFVLYRRSQNNRGMA